MDQAVFLDDLSPADLLIIDKKHWRLLWHCETWVHVLEHRGFMETRFATLDIVRGLATGAITVRRAPPFLPPQPPADEDTAFAGLNERGQREVHEIYAKCLAILELHSKGELSLTDAGIAANRGALEQRAKEILRGDVELRARQTDPGALVLGCSRTVLQDYRDWRRAGGSLRPLVDRRRLGLRRRRSRSDEPLLWKYFLIARNLHLSTRNTTVNYCVSRAMVSYNADQKIRAERNDPPLPGLSERTLRRYLENIDPMESKAARHGRDYAVALLRTSVAQDRPHKIGDRVEIDGHHTDLHSLADKNGLLSEMAPEYRKEAKNFRMRMIKAVDGATGIVLGASFGMNETSVNARRCIDMVVRDKRAWSNAAGCKNPWRHHCVPQAIVSDTGSAFVSNDTVQTLLDLDISPFWPMAEHPYLRGRIEKHNHTEDTKLFRHLYGQVSPSRGWPKKPSGQELACLVVSDFMRVMIRWTCDVYHQTPQDALDGMTPDQAWDFHLARTSMVSELPGVKRRRALGDRIRRCLDAEGIEVLGIAYHSEQLYRLGLRELGRELEVATDPHDIGWISVKVGGQWIDVEAPDPRFHGVTRDEWCLARDRLKTPTRDESSIGPDAVILAIDDIRKVSAEAARFSGLRDADLGGFELEHLKNEATVGIRVRASASDGPSQGDALPGTSLGGTHGTPERSDRSEGWWYQNNSGDPS